MSKPTFMRGIAIAAAALAMASWAGAADAQSRRHRDAEDCHFEAQERAWRHVPPGAGALGVIANGARAQAERDYAYRRAFDDCMDGYRR